MCQPYYVRSERTPFLIIVKNKMHHNLNKWDYNDMDKLFVEITADIFRVINRRKSVRRAHERKLRENAIISDNAQ